MPFKRPTPLAEEDLEATPSLQQHLAAGRGPMLLGRANMHSPMHMKSGTSSAADCHARTPMKPLTIAEGAACNFDHLSTPLAATPSMTRWGCTPMATPSPSARLAMFEHLRLTGALPTPGGNNTSVAVTPGAGPPARQKAELVLSKALDMSGAAAEAQEDDDESTGRCANDSSDGEAPRAAGAPPPDGAQHPSLGSEGHAAGTCRRCCFFSRGRCINGYECQFCHYEHEKPKRKHRSRHAGKPTADAPEPSRAAVMRPLVTLPQGMCWVMQPNPTLAMGLQSWPVMQQQQQQQGTFRCP